MTKRINTLFLMVVITLCGSLMIGAEDCGSSNPPVSSSGVTKATVQIPTGSDGLTTEQRNIQDRLKQDNKPGVIKHLYVISAYSGQVLIYSTVRGKVTSGGKRLTPTSVTGNYSDSWHGGFDVNIGGSTQRTNEVLQDDGTYGSSGEYLYWWDTKGIYHQHWVQGGQILHVSSEPLSVKSVVINMEVTGKDAPSMTEAVETNGPKKNGSLNSGHN